MSVGLKVRVHIFYKPSVFDPQGHTTAESLRRLGFGDVSTVRVGKAVDIELPSTKPQEVEKMVHEMCDKLLVNPVIESYSYEVLSE